MEIRHVEFQFKGQRNYIQGPDILNAMLAVAPNGESLKNIRFVAHSFIETPSCDLYLAEDKQEFHDLAEVSARCHFDLHQRTLWLAMKPSTIVAPVRRSDFDEASLLALCQVKDDRITLERQSPFSFIETIVSMNKCLHQHMFADVAGKWIFTRLDLDEDCERWQQIEIRLRHNMHYRLTKSDICVAGRKMGDLYFSLVKP